MHRNALILFVARLTPGIAAVENVHFIAVGCQGSGHVACIDRRTVQVGRWIANRQKEDSHVSGSRLSESIRIPMSQVGVGHLYRPERQVSVFGSRSPHARIHPMWRSGLPTNDREFRHAANNNRPRIDERILTDHHTTYHRSARGDSRAPTNPRGEESSDGLLRWHGTHVVVDNCFGPKKTTSSTRTPSPIRARYSLRSGGHRYGAALSLERGRRRCSRVPRAHISHYMRKCPHSRPRT